MLQFEPIKVEDKERMQLFLEQDNVMATERNFACLFIWAAHYSTEVCITDEFCFIRMKGEGDRFYSYYPPLIKSGLPTREQLYEAIHAIAEVEKRDEILFFSLMEEQVTLYQETLGNKVEIIESPSSSDYIYNAKDLVELIGKKYSAKRNHINKFKKLYGDCFTYRKLQFREDFEKIMEFHGKWCIEKDEDKQDSYQHEYCAIRKAANYAEALELKGGILLVREEVVAYTIGCQTNTETFDVLIEKGTTEIEGCYAMINQCFAKENYHQYTYINREEDLGIEGLRKAKLSYYPERLLSKYRAKVNITKE